jgi:hypothetical protein
MAARSGMRSTRAGMAVGIGRGRMGIVVERKPVEIATAIMAMGAEGEYKL